MDMEFDFSSVNRMGRTYADGARIVMQEARKGITNAVVAIEQDAKRIVPTDTHYLQKSLSHEVETHGNDITGRAGSNVVYAPVVEFGRSAGAPMPPFNDAFRLWMQHKGIPLEVQFAVRRSIARRGTRPRPYLKPALEKNRPAITREMTAVLKRISNRLAAGNG